MASKKISFRVPKEVGKSLAKIKADGRKVVQVVGKLENGKLEVSSEGIAELTKMFPSANITFVAVNAPFKSI